MLKALKEIVAGTTFYYKQVNFFLLLGVIIIGGFWIKGLIEGKGAINASTELPRELTPDNSSLSVDYDIVINKSGEVKVNERRIAGAFDFTQTADEFLLVLVRDAKTDIASIRAVVHLPEAVDNFDQIRPRIYAIHGVESSNFSIVNDRTVEFTATGAMQGSGVSIGFTFPKNYFTFTNTAEVAETLSTIPLSLWIGVGILLPSLTAAFLGYLLLARLMANAKVRNNTQVNSPPLPTPPALVGALYHGYIGKKEITATLFDLAERGFLAIHQGFGEEMIFSKGANLFTVQANALRLYEIFLLHQLFGTKGFSANQQEISVGLESELFSRKVAYSIVNIYDAAVAEGYFVQSPNKYYFKYKMTGITLFFIALVALLYGSFVLPEPAPILFAWFGMMIAALLAIWATPGLPHRTSRGSDALRQWMGLRNYLTAKELIVTTKTSEFFTLLPYAIVLDCEQDWIERWREQSLVLPEWFSGEMTPHTAQDYSNSLVGLINFLSRHLFSARPPDLA